MEVVLPRFGGNVRRVLAYGTLSLYLWRAKLAIGKQNLARCDEMVLGL